MEKSMKKINRLVTAIAASCLLLLSGCATQKETMIKEGYPLAYAEGFDDGCHSGRKAGGNMFEQFKKDVRRFDKDSQYAQGWSDGFRQTRGHSAANTNDDRTTKADRAT